MGQAKRAGQPPQIGLPHVRQAPGRRSPPISGARQDQAAAGNARQDQAAAGNARQHQAVPGNARQHQAARRAAADRELLDEMAAAGFAGPVHEMFTSSLAAYGLAVMLAWIGSGEITARCQAAGRPLPGDAAPETLSADDRLEVAAETVARALRYFFIRVVRAGQWDHRRGTSLRTFFVGACVLQFPPVYGAWTGKRRWAGIRDGQNPGAEADAVAWAEADESAPAGQSGVAAGLIERSSLGTAAATHVRSLAAAADVTAVMARLRQLSTGAGAAPGTTDRTPAASRARGAGTASPAAGPAAAKSRPAASAKPAASPATAKSHPAASAKPAASPATATLAASLLAADARRVAVARPVSVRRGSPGSDADQALTVLYETHYRALTQLATLLVSDVATAEDIVQDAFVAMHGAWRQLRDGGQALLYLQQVVVRRARSSRPARGGPGVGAEGRPAAGRRKGSEPEPRLVAALRSLPARQREALVLRYYADLPEAQIGPAMGISGRAVSNHVARGMSALQAALERGQPDGGPPAAGAAGDAGPA